MIFTFNIMLELKLNAMLTVFCSNEHFEVWICFDFCASDENFLVFEYYVISCTCAMCIYNLIDGNGVFAYVWFSKCQLVDARGVLSIAIFMFGDERTAKI